MRVYANKWHGYLLHAEGSTLFVRAESHAGGQEVKTLHRDMEEIDQVCKAIVRYVHRTGERVILDRATQDGDFKVIGMLYLENRLADAAFTPKQAQVTELLMLQAAICEENARLENQLTTLLTPV